ncbi:hypothetical protein OCK02_11150 [Rhizobium sp. TRM96647]|uniref:hypothetical protein n=1 Tax=unclassified Rhizobium TaxID=2613769 RepID=UPI0021E77D79|nr:MULTISPECIES: hypothetical protein [unclassified Rhizobium]MCV3736764.1 hypothetical protein [Rhizobium sp. TRM96647]MCV3756836.1 hypothetical protein [Rhizobium sp. TRM96650]
MNALWPWLMLAGLGAFHGLNPAMGWLFAVALGVHRQSGAAVARAVPAIAIGHAASVAAVAGALVTAGLAIDEGRLRIATGCALVAWAIAHALYGHRRRVRVGMTTGLLGLAAWSFLMATAHGAGLMVLPALMPLCLADGPLAGVDAGRSAVTALAAVGVHTAAMLAATALAAFAVYRFVGLGILRSGWINVDLVWTLVLAATGLMLIFA